MDSPAKSSKRTHEQSGLTPVPKFVRSSPHHSTPLPRTSRKQLFKRCPQSTPRSGPRFITSPSPHLRKLATPKRGRKMAWSTDELKSLVQYVALHQDLQPTSSVWHWPAMSAKHVYWTQAARFIADMTTCPERLASSVRNKVTKELATRFKTLDEAEDNLGLGLDSYSLSNTSSCSTNEKLSSVDHVDIDTKSTDHLLQCLTRTQLISLFNKVVDKCLSIDELVSAVDDITRRLSNDSISHLVTKLFSELPVSMKVSLLNSLFLSSANDYQLIHVQELSNFIDHSLKGMSVLQQHSQPNAIAKFARCLGVEREDGTPLFPINRMPWGLVLYQIEFFNCSHINQVTIPEDYYQWCETVTAQGKGASSLIKVLRGPMWSGCTEQQIGKPEQAKVNIAFPSYKSLQERLKKSEFLSAPVVQVEALKCLPKDTRYWIKIDGTDVSQALMETGSGEWFGDDDCEKMALASLREEYDRRRKLVNSTPTSATMANIINDLEADLVFLSNIYQEKCKLYTTKLSAKNTSQESLKEAAWECVETQELLSLATKELITLRDSPPVSIKHLKGDLLQLLKQVFKKKRVAATHILILMVSCERRCRKPYAVPVQYIPYKSLKDQYIRDLTTNLKTIMVQLGLQVAGVVTDGEFHTLRSRGDKRPLHLYQIIHDSRDAVKRMSADTLTKMLTLDAVDPVTGEVLAELPSEAIPSELLIDIAAARAQGQTFEQAVLTERQSLVPAGHVPHTFNPSRPECHTDVMKSLVATSIFRREISTWKEQGVDFSSHLYVPETDSVTGGIIQERGDHNHILKRMATSTRELKYIQLSPDSFDEALLDRHTGLTHAALTGMRKQSVPDAERLLSYHMAQFMEQHGYGVEAEYIKRIASWHEASDGRGITQLQRCRANHLMLNYILDEWMPWHRHSYNFSLIDINRPMTNIRGFSYQTLIEVTTNIESQEYRRRENALLGYSEHPRAATTDDVECFFSLVRRHLGGKFTLREFQLAFPRLVREFVKKMTDDLPFYYWTLNERYRLDQPGFDDDQNDHDNNTDHNYNQQNPLRLHHLVLNRREDAAIFTVGRALIPARHRPHLRERLYRPDVGLPPVPEDML